MRDAFTENRKNVATINASLESSISGIRVSKAYTAMNHEIEKGVLPFENSTTGEVGEVLDLLYKYSVWCKAQRCIP